MNDKVLPKNSFQDENYCLERVCTKCGSKKYEEDNSKYSYLTKSLSVEGVDVLKEVNKMAEFYHHKHLIILNKKVHDIIKKYDSTAQFSPVVLK